MIELCDHFEYFSEPDEGQADNDNGDDNKKFFDDVEIPAEETQGGYASGPENLEHTTHVSMLDITQ